MESVYEKQTKDTVDFPTYVTRFLMALTDKLKQYGFMEDAGTNVRTIILPIVSETYSYCYDAISLIEKTINRMGFTCKMDKYKTIEIQKENGNKAKGYSYDFRITKAKKLPINVIVI